jgi:hypothetical protein
MTFYRWYTGLELHRGEKPKWYLGRAHVELNQDGKLYVLIPFNIIVRLLFGVWRCAKIATA